MTLYYPPTQNGLQKTLDAQLDQGHTSAITLNNTTGVQNKPGVVVINRISADGTEKSSSEREFIIFTGTSGATLTGLTRGVAGSSDIDHAISSVVEFISDVTFGQGLIDTLLVEHSTAGVHQFSQILDTNGNEAVIFSETASAVNEITIVNSATGNPVAVSATGGDTNIDLKLVGKGTGTVKKPLSAVIQVLDGTTNTATGDGKAYFAIPPELNGMVITGVFAAVITAGTTNTTDIQIRNVTDSVDVLSTKLTIDSGETTSATAAAAAVINTSNDDVATNDIFAIDVDAVSTTPAKGLIVRITFGF